jgi:hypothetical protein
MRNRYKTIYTDVEVEVDLEDFSDEELLDELAERDLIPDSGGNGNELIDKIFHLRRQGKNFDKELDEYLYIQTGRAI